jgi:hypothetical protein
MRYRQQPSSGHESIFQPSTIRRVRNVTTSTKSNMGLARPLAGNESLKYFSSVATVIDRIASLLYLISHCLRDWKRIHFAHCLHLLYRCRNRLFGCGFILGAFALKCSPGCAVRISAGISKCQLESESNSLILLSVLIDIIFGTATTWVVKNQFGRRKDHNVGALLAGFSLLILSLGNGIHRPRVHRKHRVHYIEP